MLKEGALLMLLNFQIKFMEETINLNTSDGRCDTNTFGKLLGL